MRKPYIITFLYTLCTFSVISLSHAQTNPISEAEFYIRSGNFQAALSTLTEYIELNQSDAEAYIKRATVYEILGQKQEKEKDLRYANYLNPFAYMYVDKRSRSRLYEKKQYDYDHSDDSPNFKKSPVNNKYYQLYLNDNLELHSQDSLLSKAILYLSQNDLQNTELILSDLEETDNIKGIVYDLRGVIELKKNRIKEAIEYFTLSIDHMPLFPLAYHNRAIAYKLQGNYEGAKDDLMTAINLNEDISVFYFTLAKLSERLENPDNAINYYQVAIEKNPQYLEARTNYSLLQKTLGNYDEAIIELEDIAINTDNESKSNFITGGFYLTFGEYEKAIDEFDEYLITHKDDSDALFNRGLAKILKGEKRNGCDDIDQSIEQNENPKRREILVSFCPDY